MPTKSCKRTSYLMSSTTAWHINYENVTVLHISQQCLHSMEQFVFDRFLVWFPASLHALLEYNNIYYVFKPNDTNWLRMHPFPNAFFLPSFCTHFHELFYQFFIFKHAIFRSIISVKLAPMMFLEKSTDLFIYSQPHKSLKDIR